VEESEILEKKLRPRDIIYSFRSSSIVGTDISTELSLFSSNAVSCCGIKRRKRKRQLTC
jgi:hypothetical protein